MVDFGSRLVFDTLGTCGRFNGSLDFDLAKRVSERFVGLETADKKRHGVRAGAVPELWIGFGKVLHSPIGPARATLSVI